MAPAPPFVDAVSIRHSRIGVNPPLCRQVLLSRAAEKLALPLDVPGLEALHSSIGESIIIIVIVASILIRGG